MNFFYREKSGLEKQLIKYAIKFQPKLIGSEVVILFILLIGMMLKSMNLGIGSQLIIVSFSIMSLVYSIMSYKGYQFENKFDAFLIQLIYGSYSIATVGILFSIQRWPGAYMMLTIGLSLMALGLIGLVVIKNKKRIDQKMIHSDFLRTIIILFIGVGFLLYGNLNEIDNPKRDVNQEIVE